jgi:ferredoxin
MTRPDAWPPTGPSASATTGRAATHTAPLALVVDRIRCDGYGMCAELLPELIELDDWGYPIVRPGAVPDQLGGLARRAVDVCPVLALSLRTVPQRS